MTDINEDDLWFVQFEGGAVRAFSLEQLDEAFQAGTIDEGTLVRLDGTVEWKPLGEVLAGADEAPASEVVAAPVAASTMPTNDVAPISAPPPPVVAELADLDIDDRANFGASKKRAAIFGGLAAAVILGGVAFTAVRVSSSAAGDPSKVTTSMAAAPAAAKVAEPAPEAAADAGPRFNEDQRRLLMEADKKREAEAAARRPPPRERKGASKPIKIGDPIKKGGSKYDPLNGAL